MKQNHSLGRKILYAMTALVTGMCLAGGGIFALTMKNVTDTLVLSNRYLSTTIGERSSLYMAEQSQNRILELAVEKADIADEIFSVFKQNVCIAAHTAEQIYSHPGSYAARTVPLPDADNDGKLTMQVLYSAGTDPADPRIPEAPPETLLYNLHAAVDAFVKDAEQFDDLTMLCLEYKGRSKDQ